MSSEVCVERSGTNTQPRHDKVRDLSGRLGSAFSLDTMLARNPGRADFIPDDLQNPDHPIFGACQVVPVSVQCFLNDNPAIHSHQCHNKLLCWMLVAAFISIIPKGIFSAGLQLPGSAIQFLHVSVHGLGHSVHGP